MTGAKPTVKGCVRQDTLDFESMTRKERLMKWCEENWIAGWYIAAASTLNVLLNLLNLVW